MIASCTHPCFFSFQKHRVQILLIAHFLKVLCIQYQIFLELFYGTVANSLNLIKPMGRYIVNYVGIYEEYPLFTVCCIMMFIVLCKSVLVLLCLLKYAKLSTRTLLAHEELVSRRSWVR